MFKRVIKIFNPFLGLSFTQVTLLNNLRTDFLFNKFILRISKHINRCAICDRVFGAPHKSKSCPGECRKKYKLERIALKQNKVSEEKKIIELPKVRVERKVRKLKDIHIEMGKCLMCEREFQKKRKGSVTCSRLCREQMSDSSKEKKANERRLKYGGGKCIVCSIPFTKRQPHQLTCSKDCRKAHEKKRYEAGHLGSYSFISFNVFERDNFRCAYCGKTSFEDGVKLIVEHIFPRSKGGTNDDHNVITACSDCNNRKKNKIMDWNIIMTLWQVVKKRNEDKNIKWSEIKSDFDKLYKIEN